MAKERTLADLYVRGQEKVFDDGKAVDDDGNPVPAPITVYVRKPNGVDVDKARRAGNAARARVMSLRAQSDSDDYLAIVGSVYETGDPETLIGYLLGPEESKVRQIKEAEVGAAEEWSTDDYLTGLRTSWLEEVAEIFVTDATDVEANRIFAELKRFEVQVEEKVTVEMADKRADLAPLSLTELWDKTAEEILKQAANLAWLKAYRRVLVWLSVRDRSNHSKRYFAEQHLVDELDDKVYGELVDLIEELQVDPLEGKDSEEAPSSSTSSEQPEEGETEQSSGLVAVAG